MGSRTLALAACLLIVPVGAGCTSLVDEGTSPAGPGAGSGARHEDCETHRFNGSTSQGPWQSAWIECFANVPGTNEQPLRCAEPQEAELTVSANLTAGRVKVQVEDAQRELVVDRWVDDTGGQPRNLTVHSAGAEPGTWILRGTRSDAFNGTYELELWCPA